ncbi:uncharacterized protein LOC121369863 [Gigantopelta aegis]|uniref:uncharacterized protein LOC121369863 n=1 Tax=Gigantopelta aegis TaxID=1735272 RepID=UPI001B88B8CC|nr:uncharacterized protein LOC121369863 [Gigantopelta aegis]
MSQNNQVESLSDHISSSSINDNEHFTNDLPSSDLFSDHAHPEEDGFSGIDLQNNSMNLTFSGLPQPGRYSSNTFEQHHSLSSAVPFYHNGTASSRIPGSRNSVSTLAEDTNSYTHNQQLYNVSSNNHVQLPLTPVPSVPEYNGITSAGSNSFSTNSHQYRVVGYPNSSVPGCYNGTLSTRSNSVPTNSHQYRDVMGYPSSSGPGCYNGTLSTRSNLVPTSSHQYRDVMGYPSSSDPGCYNGTLSTRSNLVPTSSHQYRDVMSYPNSSGPGCYNGTLSTRSNLVPTSSHQYRDVMGYPSSSGPGCYNGTLSTRSNLVPTSSHQYRDVMGYPSSSGPGCYNGTLSTRSNLVPTSSHQYRDVMSYPNSSGPGCYNGTLSTRSNLVPTSSHQYRDVMGYPSSSDPGCYNGTLSTRSNSVPTSSLQNSGQNGPPTTQRFFIDTNQYVTVSGSYEEPMDESVEEVQIASDVRAENRLELRSEWVRLHTFFRKWPNDMPPQINPSTLSQDGFYYLGPFDRVRCIFCSGILKKWDAEDIVETEHRKHFPKCPFVLGLDVGNIPLDRSAVSTNVISKSDSFGVLSVQNFGKPSNESPSERAETLGIVQNKPKHPRFSLEADRLATFKNWPSQIKQQPEQLAKAGLFYVGNSDNVKCFTCDGLLSQWEPGDDPWIEHARWFPDCQFVRLVKGDNFIEQALQRETPMEEKETKSHSEKEHKQDSVAIQALLENGCKMQEVSEAIKWLHENGGVPDDVIPSAEKIYKIILDKEMTPNGNVVSEDFQDQKRKSPNKNSEETGGCYRSNSVLTSSLQNSGQNRPRTIQPFFTDTNPYVTVSGSYEEPMDESDEEVQIASDEKETKSHSENSAAIQAVIEMGCNLQEVDEAIKLLHENGEAPVTIYYAPNLPAAIS